MTERNSSLTMTLVMAVSLILAALIATAFILVSNLANRQNQAFHISRAVLESQDSESSITIQPEIIESENFRRIRLDLSQSGFDGRLSIDIPAHDLHSEVRKFWIALFVVSGLGMLAIVLLTRRFITPLNQLALQAEHLARGYLNQPIHVQSSGEVLVLAQVLDNMRLQFRQLMSGAVSKAMVWEGKLEFLALSQLLTILHVTKRTGAIMIQGPGQVGVIYIDHGEIAGARYRNLTGDDAFWVMFRWETGYFKFSREMKVERDTLSPWYRLMLEGARRVSSLRLIEGYIPSMDFKAEVSPFAPQERVEILLPQERELFYLVDGEHSVFSLAEKLQWTPEKAQRYLYRLAVIGLVECEYLPREEPENPKAKIIDMWKFRVR